MPLRRLHGAGSALLTGAQYAGLTVIALATVVAGVQEVMVMIGQGKVSLADLLLMFIYLEVLTMTGLYYQSGQLPVRFPLYIAIVALARYLILDTKQLDAVRIAAVGGGIVMLSIAVLVLRYGQTRFPDLEDDSAHKVGNKTDRP